MKAYRLEFKSSWTSWGIIYCIAENERNAKDYIRESIDNGEVFKIEEVSMNDVSISDLSAGDIFRLINSR